VLVRLVLYFAFLWGVVLVIMGWFVSRQAQRSAFHFWFSLAAAEATRWSLTLFLIQNVGKPLYATAQFTSYGLGGLYGAMVTMLLVALVGIGFWLRERHLWPGGYYAAWSILGLLALVITWLQVF